LILLPSRKLSYLFDVIGDLSAILKIYLPLSSFICQIQNLSATLPILSATSQKKTGLSLAQVTFPHFY
jgi:hypothetical protein